MDDTFTPEQLSHIKQLINEDRDFPFIKEVYSDLTKYRFRQVKYGYKDGEIEPLTKHQVKRDSKKKKVRIRTSIIKINSPDLNSIPPVQVEEKEYPKVVKLILPDEETYDFILKYLEDKKRALERKMAIHQLLIIALQTGDFSDLPPSAVGDLEKATGYPFEEVKRAFEKKDDSDEIKTA
jgi:hypothetical protein